LEFYAMPTPVSQCVYDFECVDLYGQILPLRQFAGRPMVIVNTASLCGFTSQFKPLEEIWQRKRDKGLVMLGVPSNDFGHQEPGSNSQIVTACISNFGISFPLLEKTAVTGDAAHPLFLWLAQEGGYLAKPRWNFYKYVIGRDGYLKDWFTSFTNPGSTRFERALENAAGS
jgi:glutathione peroxidase